MSGGEPRRVGTLHRARTLLGSTPSSHFGQRSVLAQRSVAWRCDGGQGDEVGGERGKRRRYAPAATRGACATLSHHSSPSHKGKQ